jgi:hypothetical protein
MRLTDSGIKITIVDDSVNQPCSGNCGKDWSQPEAIETARQEIYRRFGPRAELEYIDLPKVEGLSGVHRIKTLVQGMPMPVLLANGRPRIAGEFDMRQLLDVIETDLEVEL